MRYLIILALFALNACGDSNSGHSVKEKEDNMVAMEGDTADLNLEYEIGGPLDEGTTLINYDVAPLLAIGMDSLRNLVLNQCFPNTCIHGKYFMQVLVDERGAYKELKFLKTSVKESCQGCLRNLIRDLTFIPGKHNGQKVETRLVLPLEI